MSQWARREEETEPVSTEEEKKQIKQKSVLSMQQMSFYSNWILYAQDCIKAIRPCESTPTFLFPIKSSEILWIAVKRVKGELD